MASSNDGRVASRPARRVAWRGCAKRSKSAERSHLVDEYRPHRFEGQRKSCAERWSWRGCVGSGAGSDRRCAAALGSASAGRRPEELCCSTLPKCGGELLAQPLVFLAESVDLGVDGLK